MLQEREEEEQGESCIVMRARGCPVVERRAMMKGEKAYESCHLSPL